MSEHTLEDLSAEDQVKITEELQAVLAKYDAEMGVKSSIEIWKRVPKSVPSPFTVEDVQNASNSDNTTEESS